MEQLPQLPETASPARTGLQTVRSMGVKIASAAAIVLAGEGCEHSSHPKMHSEANAFNDILGEMGYEVKPVYLTNFDECQALSLRNAKDDLV